VFISSRSQRAFLVVEVPTRDEVIEEVPIVAQKLIESYRKRGFCRSVKILSEIEIPVAL
jgi:hypothetical protein